MGQLFSQAEYQVGKYQYSAPNNTNIVEKDFNHGGSISVAYEFTDKLKYSGKKGALVGLKCKRYCFMLKDLSSYFFHLDSKDY
ncbi:hypothetical protein OA848_00340 [Rickettsiales bacterium]|nr:hypothetical protein [Rickettsiales bacterium]